MPVFGTEIDGVKYKTEAPTQAEAISKMEVAHRDAIESGQVQPSGLNIEGLEQSGVANALLAGLSNDQDSQVRWLAERRFPEFVERGIDPFEWYTLADGEIVYKDPYSGDMKKEFRDSILGGDVHDIFGKVAPAAQLLAEVVPGTLGLMAGAVTAGPVGAMAGGGGLTFLGGRIMYAARESLSESLDGPPLNIEKAINDLRWSTGFGSLPIGVPAKSFGAFSEGLIRKFPGAKGKAALRTILEEGGKTADDKILFAQERFGTTLTRPEAMGMVGTAGEQIQKYLQAQPTSQKLWNFYHNRAAQVEEAAHGFFTELFEGRYVRAGIKNKLTGRESLDAPMDVAESLERFVKIMGDKRKVRADKIYKGAWELDTPVDISDILTEITEKLADKNVGGPYRSALERMKRALTDQNAGFDVVDDVTGKTVKQFPPKTDMEMLQQGLLDDFGPLIESLGSEGARTLKARVSNIRGRLSERMKLANPEYLRATEVYDPTKGHLQWLDRSIVKQLAEVVEKGGSQAARLTDRLFSGQISPREVRRLRKIMHVADPQAWQNLKGTWLMTQFDDAVAGSINPLGAPNKFLSKLGLRGTGLSRAQQVIKETSGIAESGARSQARSEGIRAIGKRARVLKEMFEPDELDNFLDLSELMQAVSFISTRSQSPTQTLQTMQKIMEQEGMKLGPKVGTLVRGIFTVPARLVARGFDDIGEGIIRRQKEAYEDVLIDALINPATAQEFRTFLDAVRPQAYLFTQTWLRGGDAAVEKLTRNWQQEFQEQRERGTFEEQRAAEEAESTRQQLGSDLDSAAAPAPAPAPVTMPQIPLGAGPMPDFDPALSPTIIPSPSDREIAERLRAQQGGIGSLG